MGILDNLRNNAENKTESVFNVKDKTEAALIKHEQAHELAALKHAALSELSAKPVVGHNQPTDYVLNADLDENVPTPTSANNAPIQGEGYAALDENVPTPTSTHNAPIEYDLPTIASSAMVVHIEFKKWGGPVIDRTATDKALSDNNAVANAGVFKKRLLPSSPELKHIENLTQNLRNRGIKFCLPWMARGQYLLPTANMADFMQAVDVEARAEWDQAVDAFIKKYPTLVKKAAVDLGALFDPLKYPGPHRVRAHFSMCIHLNAVQLDGEAAFYKTLTEQQKEQCEHIIRTQNREQFLEVRVHLYDMLRKPILALLEKLDEKLYDEGYDAPKFQQRKVDNIIEAANDVTSLNVGNEAELASTVAKLNTALRGVTVGALKDDSYYRNEVRNNLTTILGGMPV